MISSPRERNFVQAKLKDDDTRLTISIDISGIPERNTAVGGVGQCLERFLSIALPIVSTNTCGRLRSPIRSYHRVRRTGE